MCNYCEDKLKRPVELMDNFPIIDDSSKIEIGDEEETPKQYIRRSAERYYLTTEVGYDTGNVFSCKILFCPMCGRKLL